MRSQGGLTIMLAAIMIRTLSAQDLPPVRNSYGAFAFPNMQGTELIVVHDVPRAAEMSTAICDRQTLRVRFVRRQTGAGMEPADRDSPEQFKRLAGSVFEVVGRPVPSGVTCFVAADPLLATAELLRVQMRAQPRECTAEEQQRAGALPSRSIRRCWSIAVGQRLGLISLVEYFIAVDWHGSEGHSLALHSVKPRTAAQQLLADYWYRAPR